MSNSISSYYFDFTTTGNKEVDSILYAVAKSAKCFHSTSQWTEDTEFCSEDPLLEGNTPLEWIQNAANKLANSYLSDTKIQDIVEKAESEYDAFTYVLNTQKISKVKLIPFAYEFESQYLYVMTEKAYKYLMSKCTNKDLVTMGVITE